MCFTQLVTGSPNPTLNVLLDSGSNIFILNQETARWLNIPTKARDELVIISTFDGETAPIGGKFYTYPILLEIDANGHRSRISCEVANAGKYDLIIPFGWWHKEHPLSDIENPKKWTFNGQKCHDYVEDEAVANMFEWDETVVYDEEAQYC